MRSASALAHVAPPSVKPRRSCALKALNLPPELLEVGLRYAALTEASTREGFAKAREVDGGVRRWGIPDGGAAARAEREAQLWRMVRAIPQGRALPSPEGAAPLSFRRLLDAVALENSSLSRVLAEHGLRPNGRNVAAAKAALEEVVRRMGRVRQGWGRNIPHSLETGSYSALIG